MIPEVFDPRKVVKSHLTSFRSLDISVAEGMVSTESCWVTPSGSHKLGNVAQLWRSVSEAWDYLPSAWSLTKMPNNIVHADVSLTDGSRVKVVKADFELAGSEIASITVHDMRDPVKLNG
ncbi:hypothetical protein [Sphingobium abikonense]|uniref:hypothetical protein n=1 Tax=Sphingobium abikonense TaxID=86193 RepID=UPI0035124A46